MKILEIGFNNQPKVIEETLNVLQQGGLVIAPTDTVYGLLADATNEVAVKKMIEFKNRPPGQPISIFIVNLPMLKKYVEANSNQLTTLKQLLPGPFTIVLKSKHKTSHLLESEKGTLGVRIPDYPFINDLVNRFGRPVTATSANLSGRSPHHQIKSLLHTLPKEKQRLIDLVINAGKLPRNKPSTIVDLTTPQLKIIRQGDIVFKKVNTYFSVSPEQTQKIAQYILGKVIKKDNGRPLVFIIEGELGVGKTIFAKGLGERLGIKDIISPTFVVYYEYDIDNPKFCKLIHIDLYNIEEPEEFKYLGIEQYLKKGNLLVFEWGEKAGNLLPILKEKANIIYVKIKYVNTTNRQIIINS